MLIRHITTKYNLWIVVVIFLVLAGCSSMDSGSGEIQITTASEQARDFFIQGRDLQENLRNDDAREYFDKAIEADPEFAQAYIYRSFTSTSTSDFLQHFQKAVELAPKASQGERLVIEITEAFVDNKAAIAVAKGLELVQKFPNDKRAYQNLANAYSVQDKDELAIIELEKAVALDKDFAPTYNSLGYAYIEMDAFEKAEVAFKNYIRLIPDEPNPHDSIADLYTKMGRHEDAISHYQKALELQPTFDVSQQKIGDNLVFRGDYEAGREAYQKAIEITKIPASKIFYNNQIARSYLYEGDFQQALSELDKSLNMAKEEGLTNSIANIHSQKCFINIQAGDLMVAEKNLADCRQVVSLSDLRQSFKDNYTKNSLYQEAMIAAKRKDFDTAEAIANRHQMMVEKDNNPNEIKTHQDLLGHIAFEKRNNTAALEHFKNGNQEDPYTLYRMALCEKELGNAEIADALLQKVSNWNENSLSYAFVRSDAREATMRDIATK